MNTHESSFFAVFRILDLCNSRSTRHFTGAEVKIPIIATYAVYRARLEFYRPYCFVPKDETPHELRNLQHQNRKPKINKERVVMLIFGAALAFAFLNVKRAPKRQLVNTPYTLYR